MRAAALTLLSTLLGVTDAQTGFGPCHACRVEMGTAVVDHGWTTITTDRVYSDPVLIVGIVTMFGNADAVVRAQVVNGNTFQMKVTESSCQDNFHAEETISWMIMEVSARPGAEAGHIELGTGLYPDISQRSPRKAVGVWEISFTAPISDPIVIVSIMSVNVDSWYTARAYDMTDNDFQLMLQEEETFAEDDRAAETVGYFAVTQTTAALGTIDGFQYYATITEGFDEMNRCVLSDSRLPCK